MARLPTTARNDVSDNEMTLRKLDRRDKAMRAIEAVVLVTLIFINLFILVNVSQLSTKNDKNIVEHRERNAAVHREMEDLICDIIIKRPPASVTDGQRKACEGKGTE